MNAYLGTLNYNDNVYLPTEVTSSAQASISFPQRVISVVENAGTIRVFLQKIDSALSTGATV